jgi:hypothetical protein
MTITWIDRKCGKSEGCAIISGDKCIVAMERDQSDALIAHEFKHCFGAEHKE